MLDFLLLVSFSLPSLAISTPGIIYAAAPEQRGAFHIGGNGVYSYGYNTGDGTAKVEVRYPDGSVSGSYRYFDPNGEQILRSYVADHRGFRVLGNDLPVAPDAPAIGIKEEQTLLATVEGDHQKISRNYLFSGNEPPTFAIYNSGIEKHKEAIRKQELLIRQEREKLQNLRNRNNFVAQKSVLSIPSQTGYIETYNDVFSTPYLYAEDNIQYDFPAGFGYNAPQVVYRVAYPVGARSFHAPLTLTAGHNLNNERHPPTIMPTTLVRKRYRRPNFDRYWKRRNLRDYVIGHAK